MCWNCVIDTINIRIRRSIIGIVRTYTILNTNYKSINIQVTQRNLYFGDFQDNDLVIARITVSAFAL